MIVTVDELDEMMESSEQSVSEAAEEVIAAFLSPETNRQMVEEWLAMPDHEKFEYPLEFRDYMAGLLRDMGGDAGHGYA